MSQPKAILVFGSGSTVGGKFGVRYNNTLWEPPMDVNFFETLIVQHLFNATDYPALSHYRQDRSLEATWAKVDLYHKLCRRDVISEERTFRALQELMNRKGGHDQAYRMKMEREDRRCCVPSIAGWELRSLLNAVFRNLEHSDRHQSPLFQVINRLLEEKLMGGIVSFNYDTSVEFLFQDYSSCPFYYPLLPDQDATGKVPLMKLHGSLNWQTDSRSAPHIRVVNDITKVAEMDHGDGWYRQPEVVGPTFFKQEITLDYEIPGDFRARHYKDLWAKAWKLLVTATHLVFVGFSFPQTDFHAAALFRTAHLSGEGLRRVILCHLNDTRVRGTVEQVFAGRQTEFTEFNEGLRSMADRLDEWTSLLRN